MLTLLSPLIAMYKLWISLQHRLSMCDTPIQLQLMISWTCWKQFLFLNRYLLKLQTEEIQIHAEEMSNLRKELEDEREDRLDLQDRFLKPNATSDLGLTWAPSRRRNGKHGTKSEEDIVSDLRRQVFYFLFLPLSIHSLQYIHCLLKVYELHLTRKVSWNCSNWISHDEITRNEMCMVRSIVLLLTLIGHGIYVIQISLECINKQLHLAVTQIISNINIHGCI